MKRSAKILLHISFWIFLPLADVFYKWSNAYDSLPGFDNLPRPSFIQILIQSFNSLFTPIDVGREIRRVSDFNDVMGQFVFGNGNHSYYGGVVFNVFIYLVLPFGFFYLFYHYFLPNTIRYKNIKSKSIPFVFILIFPLIFTTIFKYFTIVVAWKFTYCLTLVYIVTVFFAVSGSCFRIIENWLLAQKLIKQNLQSELALLKNQINPHFLFNTLNNIDSLIKSNVDKASETLVKLSGILRYMIYDTNIEKVLLSDEISHIESYVDLQKIQFANNELVSLLKDGNIDNLLIAPMLFIPFVENAFKHCNVKDIKNAIRINFSIDNKVVNFECINSFDKTRWITKDNASGIGINIIKRRLELIYPDRHTLIFTEDNNNYKVLLSINTDEN